MKHPYGYKDSNPKIDLFVYGQYHSSTNWAKTCKDAIEAFIAKNPQYDGAIVKASIDHRA